MNNKRTILPIACLILAAFLCVLSFAENESETNTEVEQHLEKANELRIASDYDAAITEFETVMSLSPNSTIAQNAQYWIGQLYYETGQFDTALSAFQKLIDEYPASTIIPATIFSIERVQQAKKNLTLFEAAQKGEVEQVKLLIAQGADVNAKIKNEQGYYRPLNTPLIIAAEKGNFEIVKVLLNSGANVNMASPTGATPLNCAVYQNHKDIAEFLVDNGAKYYINDTSYFPALRDAVISGSRDMIEYFISKVDDTSSLHIAACAGNLSKVQEFIDKGTEVDTKDKNGLTALFWAASSGQTEVAEFLITKGADINSDIFTNILAQAAKAGELSMVKLLISKGADINNQNSVGSPPLINAIRGGHLQIVKLLISEGADTSGRGNMPLRMAVGTGQMDMVKLLLDNGADANAGNIPALLTPSPLDLAKERGYTEIVELLREYGAEDPEPEPVYPLHEAAAAGDIEKVKQLISKGADLEEGNDTANNTPLREAVLNGQMDVVKLLIKNGADVNAKNDWGWTPLQFNPLGPLASGGNIDIDIAKLLIDNGADVNGGPLRSACRFGNKEFAELLIDKGADVNEKGGLEGGTLLHFGRRTNWSRSEAHINIDIVKLLLDKGVDVNAKDNSGWTPLHSVCQYDNKEVVELLIEKGADVNAKNDSGQTPKDIAEERDYTEIVELLKKHGAK